VAFVVATKHHLREEFGTDYYDLDVLLPKNWIPAAAAPEIRVVSNPIATPLSAPAGAGQAALAAQASSPNTAPQGGGGDNPNDPVNIPIGFHEPEVSAQYAARDDLPDEPDADMSLPMEILFRINLYVAQSVKSKVIDGGTAGTITGGINNLTECLGAFERILYTPIPKAYTIHLKQAIFLYILALPFTLVKELQWFVIPMVGLVSFTLLGIEGIGSEIENPFGYDDNDLPLNQYCEELKKEVEYIIYHVPHKSQSILLEGR